MRGIVTQLVNMVYLLVDNSQPIIVRNSSPGAIFSPTVTEEKI